MIMGWATHRAPSAGEAPPQLDQSPDPVARDPTGRHANAYRLGTGELGEQLQAPTAPVRIQPLQLDTHVAEGAAVTLRSQGRALIAATLATRSQELPRRAAIRATRATHRDRLSPERPARG